MVESTDIVHSRKKSMKTVGLSLEPAATLNQLSAIEAKPGEPNDGRNLIRRFKIS